MSFEWIQHSRFNCCRYCPRTGRVLTPAGTDNGFSDKKKPCFVNRTYSGSDYQNRIFQYWHSVFRNCGIVGVFRRTGPHILSSAHVLVCRIIQTLTSRIFASCSLISCGISLESGAIEKTSLVISILWHRAFPKLIDPATEHMQSRNANVSRLVCRARSSFNSKGNLTRQVITDLPASKSSASNSLSLRGKIA